MPLVSIQPPPGMFRNGTQYEAAGRWYDGNLVRWENQRIKPIGGWQFLAPSADPLEGTARGGIAFEDNAGVSYLFIGTNTKLYESSGGRFTDVTPGDFVAGNTSSLLGAGYGTGNYGVDTGGSAYGTPRSVPTFLIKTPTWSFDTFGNSVVMVSGSDRKLRVFDPVAGTVATAPGSPPCIAVMATNENFLLAIGANNDHRQVAWASVGTNSVWVPTTTNSAGDLQINTDGRLLAGARIGAQNLVWTDTDVHTVNFIGPPAIYGSTKIGNHCGLIGPRAWAGTDIAYWMGIGGFFLYNGVVTPMQCEVQDYLWRIIDFTQTEKIYAATITRFNEVIWFFPSIFAPPIEGDPLGAHEVDSYVIYNYKDNIWYFGIASTLARTTWVDRGVYPVSHAVDPFGNVYQQEIGYLNAGASRTGQVRAKSGFVEIAQGEKIIYANLLLPDGDNLSGVVDVNITSAFAPEGPIITQTIDLTPNLEGYIPVRITGRQVALELINTQDGDWSLGKPRLNIIEGGRR